MAAFVFDGVEYVAQDGESVLDCLLREGVDITNSCRSGICHSCLLKSSSKLESASQKGLSTPKKEAGYFLSCQQKAYPGIEVHRLDTSTLFIDAKITSQKRISDSVVIVEAQTSSDYPFRAGQFTNIIRADGTCRSYSIASQTGSKTLEFHVRKVPGGELSGWLYDSDLINESIKLSEPLGECCLTTDMQGKDLLLIGVGTGLAPLYGVLKDSLAEQKMGTINLLHGGLSIESLYLVDSLKSLEQEHEFFNYHPVFLKGEEREGFRKGDLVELIKNFEFDKANTVVMICGDPQLVKSLKQTIFLSGVPSKNILSDPFVSHAGDGKKNS